MIGDDFTTPIMYQDLASTTSYMNPMIYTGYPSMLGGVRMRPQPDSDMVEVIHKNKNQDKKTFKKVLTALGVILALGAIPTIRKGIKKSGGIFKYIKSFFVKTPSRPSRMSRFKNWCSQKWTGFKNLFRKSPTPPATPPAAPTPAAPATP